MSYRNYFPSLETICYLNSCSMGLLAEPVKVSIEQYMQDRIQHGSHWGLWVEKLEKFRTSIAAFLGVPVDEIAVVPSASNAVNAFASAIELSAKRNKIICSAYDFPTTAQIWQAQIPRGAQVAYAKPNQAEDSNISIETFEQLIDERTALVSIPHVCYLNGSVLPVKEIIQIAHAHGARVMVDCCQSVGNTHLQAQDLGADVLLGGMQKYMLGSTGVAFMHIKQEYTESLLPTHSGWFAQDDINAMDAFNNTPANNARRFEAGTPCVPNLYAAIAAVKLLNQIGMETIHAQIDHLTTLIKAQAEQAGFVLNTDVSAHRAMLSFRTTQPEEAVARLANEKIISSSRANGLRISPHFYNNESDIQQLFHVLNKNKELFVSKDRGIYG